MQPRDFGRETHNASGRSAPRLPSAHRAKVNEGHGLLRKRVQFPVSHT